MFRYIQNPDLIDQQTVCECEYLLREYPYFEAAHLLYLKSVKKTDESRYREILPKHICHVKNNRNLFFYSESVKFDWLTLCSTNEKDDDKSDNRKDAVEMIDSFLEAYRADKKKQAEKDTVSLVDFAPVVDYSYLEKRSSFSLTDGSQPHSRSKSYQDELIDRFIEDTAFREKTFRLDSEQTLSQSMPEEVELSVELQKEEPLSENIARNYIKQHRYEEALQIIQKLSLIYPEKNIYFADQIRFLRKLIININSK